MSNFLLKNRAKSVMVLDQLVNGDGVLASVPTNNYSRKCYYVNLQIYIVSNSANF